jgi:inner membrane protein
MELPPPNRPALNLAAGQLVAPLINGISTTVKMFLIGALVMLLMIPLALIRGVLAERIGQRDRAESEVTEGWGGHQTISPPFLSARATTTYSEEIDGKTVLRQRSDVHSVLADKVTANAVISVSKRVVANTYELPVYIAKVTMTGEFSPEDLSSFAGIAGINLNSAQCEFLAGDVTGMSKVTKFTLGGIELRAASLGNAFGRASALGAALSTPRMAQRAQQLLSYAIASQKPIAFVLEYEIKGVHSLHVLPTSRALNVTLSSNWPHPSFIGGLLPNTAKVQPIGFNAQWSVSEFNRDFPQIGPRDNSSDSLSRAAPGVSLVQMADVYQRNDRAGKYGFLFLALSIAGFFLVEILLKVKLHPMHYLQIGLALGLFYLLLLALSERLGFDWAFLLSAGAITVLIGAYTSAVLKGVKRGAIAGGVIGVTYGFLFILMAREQYALVLGALGLLVILALIMYLTRNINWQGNGAVTNAKSDTL